MPNAGPWVLILSRGGFLRLMLMPAEKSLVDESRPPRLVLQTHTSETEDTRIPFDELCLHGLTVNFGLPELDRECPADRTITGPTLRCTIANSRSYRAIGSSTCGRAVFSCP